MDEESNVIGILKKKTTWYIILRALREKLRSFLSAKSSTSLQELEKRVTARLISIKSWIGFTSEDLEKWKTISIEFLRWFDLNYRSNAITREDHSNRFPVLWYDL